jgi:hypothetical protein
LHGRIEKIHCSAKLQKWFRVSQFMRSVDLMLVVGYQVEKFGIENVIVTKSQCQLKAVKNLIAILSAVLLVWMPLPSASALTPCATPAKVCIGDCSHMACCAGKNQCGSQNLPAVPGQKSGGRNQVSLLVSTVVVWISAAYPTVTISSSSASRSIVTVSPIYARHCSLLL